MQKLPDCAKLAHSATAPVPPASTMDVQVERVVNSSVCGYVHTMGHAQGAGVGGAVFSEAIFLVFAAAAVKLDGWPQFISAGISAAGLIIGAYMFLSHADAMAHPPAFW